MQQEREKALEAIRNLIAYYTSDFHEGNGYTGKQQLIYLTRPQAEIALRYGIPIGVRNQLCTLMGTTPGKPFRYITIKDVKKLEKWLGFESTEPLDHPCGSAQRDSEESAGVHLADHGDRVS